VVKGALSYEGRIYVPGVNSFCGKVIRLFHDTPESSHFGAVKTTELESRDFYWPAMDSHIHQYVSGCELCHRMQVPQHPRYGINMPLETPSQAWEHIAMTFVNDFP